MGPSEGVTTTSSRPHITGCCLEISESVVQVAEQPHPSATKTSSSGLHVRVSKQPCGSGELVVVGGAVPRGRESWRTRENVGRGGNEKEWTNCLGEDRRMFGITGDWSTTTLDPGA